MNRPSPTISADAWLLRGVCAVMLLGHGWMCWNAQMPLRALLWDEGLMTGPVRRLTGMDWNTWVTSMEVDAGIGRAIRVQAWVFFLLAASALVPSRRRLISLVYAGAAANLFFLAWLKFLEAGMGVAQWIEHAGQFCLPLVLLLYVRGLEWTLLAKASLAATFIGHGVYAIGLPSEIPWLNHPRPGSFTEMTMLCLKIETESAAGRFLLLAGIADFVVATLVFLPGTALRIGLAYMSVWGFLTALARPWAYYEPTAAAETLIRWIPEMLYRAPHFGLPLVLLLALRRRRTDLSASHLPPPP